MARCNALTAALVVYSLLSSDATLPHSGYNARRSVGGRGLSYEVDPVDDDHWSIFLGLIGFNLLLICSVQRNRGLVFPRIRVRRYSLRYVRAFFHVNAFRSSYRLRWERRVPQPLRDEATLGEHAEACLGGTRLWDNRPRLKCVTIDFSDISAHCLLTFSLLGFRSSRTAYADVAFGRPARMSRIMLLHDNMPVRSAYVPIVRDRLLTLAVACCDTCNYLLLETALTATRRYAIPGRGPSARLSRSL